MVRTRSWKRWGCAALAGAALACTGGRSSAAPAPDGGEAAAGTLRLGTPELLGGTALALVPVERQVERGSLGSSDPDDLPVTNLVLHDVRAGTSRLLFERRVAVLRHEVLTRTPDGSGPALGVLLDVVEQDTHRDGTLDESDASRAWFLELPGGRLTVLTPAGSTVLDWTASAADGVVLLRVRDDAGRVRVLSAALSPPTQARPAADEALLEKARALEARGGGAGGRAP